MSTSPLTNIQIFPDLHLDLSLEDLSPGFLILHKPKSNNSTLYGKLYYKSGEIHAEKARKWFMEKQNEKGQGDAKMKARSSCGSFLLYGCFGGCVMLFFCLYSLLKLLWHS